LFPGYVDVGRGFLIAVGDQPMMVGTLPFGDGSTAVSIGSQILQGVRPASELYEYIATEMFLFARLRADLDETGTSATIWAEYHILGDYLDSEELKNAIEMIVIATSTYAPVVAARFGGTKPPFPA
jgi:hypothetical protein